MASVEIAGGEGHYQFTAGPEQVPNVWAEVTAIYATQLGGAQVHPYSSFALVNLPVADPARALEVRLDGLPGEIRPESRLTCTVAVTAQGQPVEAEVTVAAVDQG